MLPKHLQFKQQVCVGIYMLFNDEKMAQMSAYFLQKRGGRMSYLKLMKMLYLSDRKSLEVTGESISGDEHYSMRHGPILSQTYDLICGATDSEVWDSWIRAESNHEVSLKRSFTLDDLGELSPFDIEVMDEVWEEVGKMKRWELVEYTHRLPEWKSPGTSSAPIDPRSQFIALGKTAEQAEDLHAALLERRALDRALADLR